MLTLKTTKQFEKDLRKQQKRGKQLDALSSVVETLLKEESLEKRHRPHKLAGNWSPFWECHIEPDWLLIYHLTGSELVLVRTGTHSDLFR